MRLSLVSDFCVRCRAAAYKSEQAKLLSEAQAAEDAARLAALCLTEI